MRAVGLSPNHKSSIMSPKILFNNNFEGNRTLISLDIQS